MGVPEQVVKITQRLLISAYEERGEVILVAFFHLVHFQRPLDLAMADEMVDLAVRVAGDVGEHRMACRTLIEAMDRHDGEQLVDGPGVGQRLEHRHVAEVEVREDGLDIFELLGHFVQLPAQVADARAGGPIEPFGETTQFEGQQAEVEHLQALLARGQRVVPTLDQAPSARFAVGVEQIEYGLRKGFVRAFVLAPADIEPIERRAPEHVEHQDAVVRGDGAAGFADDHRMRDAAGLADAADAVHDIVRVFLDAVVHRGGIVAGRAVVVDAETTADVDVLEAGTEKFELRVDMRELVDGVLDALDVLQLAARVAVHELQAVEHAVTAQFRDRFQDLGDEEAELRLLAG